MKQEAGRELRARWQPWWQAARPMAHAMLALPLLWSQGLALLVTGAFEWRWFVLLECLAICLQVYILYLNDYADETVDRLNDSFWLSGGSRVIPEGRLRGEQLYRASFLALAALAILSLVFLWSNRPWMPLFVSLAAIMAWTYSLKPLQSAYRGRGELHQALACGVLLPVIGWYAQTGSLAAMPWLSLLPVALLFLAGNMTTALPDTPSDRQGGKQSYSVRQGERRARRDILLVLLLSYCGAALWRGPGVPVLAMVVAVSAPALVILGLVLTKGLLERAESSRPAACRQFVFLVSASQLWLLLGWILLLFWQGML